MAIFTGKDSRKAVGCGEFGVSGQQSTTYNRWLSAVLLDDGGGAMVWQLLEGARKNNVGFVVRWSGTLFAARTSNGNARPSQSFSLVQKYPNLSTVRLRLPSCIPDGQEAARGRKELDVVEWSAFLSRDRGESYRTKKLVIVR